MHALVIDEEQNIIRELLEGMIIKYEARRWAGTAKGLVTK